ncbi:MAG: indolepyruvate ferredoxin oxidoreductase [Acidiferrobacteraceae bacterium]|nr:indolepyruvate ferredoxin oxidoreductase [Acidiferrobacteraceae bacterium]
MSVTRSSDSLSNVSLEDKYTIEQGRVYLTGTQALVRLMLMQATRDQKAGLHTAGFVTGYRGSPLGALDQQLMLAKEHLDRKSIRFLPAVNEELAATSIWGAQQAELSGKGLYDGVFGLWYGKGPGVDRCGDVFRHGNLAGSAKMGGVLIVMGDDHTAESSTTVHQSEFGLVNVLIPILNPASVQDVVRFGLYGWAMSRFSGCWVGMKCVHDTIESSASIEINSELGKIIIPDDFDIPSDGLNIRRADAFLEQERRIHKLKLPAAQAFARVNSIDQLVIENSQAHIGIVTTGKAYSDVRRAFLELDIDDRRAMRFGLRLYKVGMSWPLEPEGIINFAKGLGKIIVVEEKRGLIEDQVKSILYRCSEHPIVIGKYDEEGAPLFDAAGRLEAVNIALELGRRLIVADNDPELSRRIDRLRGIRGRTDHESSPMIRSAYFCAGCPHNRSTSVPEDSRALAGIGCHFMAQWMERNTSSFTQMGGEGAGWIGESMFSADKHVFQNIGDGTYFHSGLLAIRAAIAAGTNITFKILYNDAVAMTGGQSVDGSLDVPRITRQVHAEGAKKIVVVTDEPGKYFRNADWAPNVEVRDRAELLLVQRELREVLGVTILVYDQTCAAEKRRRRSRGTLPTPDRRILINEEVCEGCGDCGVQSNCVAIIPAESSAGRKRAIDQSSCNMDYSCVEGFCPSFVSVRGARLVKAPLRDKFNSLSNTLLLEPELAPILGNYNIVVTGVGGTGVVTVGALLGMAAHISKKGCSVLDMAGLAQKGGAVTSHIILSEHPESITSTHVADGGADLLLGCDIVTSASPETLRKTSSDTLVVLNTYEMMTGNFTRKPDIEFPSEELVALIEAIVGSSMLHRINATKVANSVFGNSIVANLVMLGYAFQKGGIPLSSQALEQAIAINGKAVEENIAAFRLGRSATAYPNQLESQLFGEYVADDASGNSLVDIIKNGEILLTAYQSWKYAQRYRNLVDRVTSAEQYVSNGGQAFAKAVAQSYAKLLAYKDEYEVARLFLSESFKSKLTSTFEPGYKLRFHLAPPIFSRVNPVSGRPSKREFGAWIIVFFRLLAACKVFRNTWFDIFRNTKDRQLEKKLIKGYEETIEILVGSLSSSNLDIATEIAAIPLDIRGYGPVKASSAKRAKEKEEALLRRFISARETQQEIYYQ